MLDAARQPGQPMPLGQYKPEEKPMTAIPCNVKLGQQNEQGLGMPPRSGGQIDEKRLLDLAPRAAENEEEKVDSGTLLTDLAGSVRGAVTERWALLDRRLRPRHHRPRRWVVLWMLSFLLLAKGSSADWVQHGDSVYRKSSETLDWVEAQAACTAEGGHLATVHAEADNRFLADLCFADCRNQRTCNFLSDCWIGLNDRRQEGHFEWVDGTPIGWTPSHFTWNREERDCFLLEGHYHDGAWEGDFCSGNPNPDQARKFYICEKPATFARLEVKEPIGLRGFVEPVQPEGGYVVGTQVTVMVERTHPFFDLEQWDCRRSDGGACQLEVDSTFTPRGDALSALRLTIQADTELSLETNGCGNGPPPSKANVDYWNRDQNMPLHHTDRFLSMLADDRADPRWQLVVRRGNSFGVKTSSVNASQVELRHCTSPGAPSRIWPVRNGTIALAQDEKVGLYEVTAPASLAGQQVIVLFDAAKPGAKEYFPGTDDLVYSPEEQREFWVHSTMAGDMTFDATQIYYQPWPLEIYDPEVFGTVLSFLHIGAEIAGGEDFLRDPWQVMRAFTWLFHSSDPDHEGVGLAHWESEQTPCPYEESRYCQGTGFLVGAKAWIGRWRENHQQAIWPANCQDFAGLFCAASRTLGIACRMTSGNRVGQDEYPGDRVLDIKNAQRLSIDDHGVRTEEERTRGNNALWGAHTWPELYLSSSPYGNERGWYVAEPTPSVTSEGRHQVGPVPLTRVRDNNTAVAGPRALSDEVAYFIAQTKGYVWLGLASARAAFPGAVGTLVPSQLDDPNVNITFRNWFDGGMRPENYVCLLAQGITLDGYWGDSMDTGLTGHLWTLSPACVRGGCRWPRDPNRFQRVGCTARDQCLPTTNLYKTSLTQGPFEGGSVPDPFATLRQRNNCQ